MTRCANCGHHLQVHGDQCKWDGCTTWVPCTCAGFPTPEQDIDCPTHGANAETADAWGYEGDG